MILYSGKNKSGKNHEQNTRRLRTKRFKVNLHQALQGARFLSKDENAIGRLAASRELASKDGIMGALDGLERLQFCILGKGLDRNPESFGPQKAPNKKGSENHEYAAPKSGSLAHTADNMGSPKPMWKKL